MNRSTPQDADRGQPTAASGPTHRSPQGETLPAQGETQQGVPRMPHERDESAARSQTADNPTAERVGRLAQADAAQARPDTSKGAELDAAYERLREDTPGGSGKDFRP